LKGRAIIAQALIAAATKHCDGFCVRLRQLPVPGSLNVSLVSKNRWRHCNNRAWLWVVSNPRIGAYFHIAPRLGVGW
jgi:hypothetical protein